MNDRDRSILTLATAHYRHEGHRLIEARSTLGLNPTAFYAAVARVISDPAAELEMPAKVRRVRRVRDERLRTVHKATRRVGVSSMSERGCGA